MQLHKAEEQLAVAKEQIEAQKKEMEEVEEAATRAEQNGYDIGVKETKDILGPRSQEFAEVTAFRYGPRH